MDPTNRRRQVQSLVAPARWAANLGLALAVCFAATAGAAEMPGVTDFTQVTVTAIQVDDLTEALSALRGTRIEMKTRPTARLPGFFESNSARIKPEAVTLLRKIGAALASSDLEPFRFSIEWEDVGGSDATADAKLASERVEAVRALLSAQGVPEAQLGWIGPSDSNRPSDRDSADDRNVALVNLGPAH